MLCCSNGLVLGSELVQIEAVSCDGIQAKGMIHRRSDLAAPAAFDRQSLEAQAAQRCSRLAADVVCAARMFLDTFIQVWFYLS